MTAGNGVDVTNGDVNIADNLNVTGNTDINGTLDVAQATSVAAPGLASTVRGTLDVIEASNFDGTVTGNNGINVTNGDVNITDNLNVTTDASITGDALVGGNFRLDAGGNPVNAIVGSVLGGGTGIASPTAAASNTALVTEQAVREAITSGVSADNGLTENPEGNIQLGGTLLQTTTIINNGFDLVVDGSAGDVTVDQTGLLTAGNGVDVTNGDVNIADNLNVTGNTDINGTLDVAEATSLAAPGVSTTVRGTLDVNEASNFDGTVTGNNGINVTNGDVNITDNLNVTTDASITGDALVGGNFRLDAGGNPVSA